MLAWPLFAALPFLARRAPFAARAGLALAGLADTAFATIMFGQASGVAAFLVPCAMLAALSFTPEEAWTSRALTALTFVVFSALLWAAPAGLAPLPTGLLSLNLYSAAALTAFIGLRFASARA